MARRAHRGRQHLFSYRESRQKARNHRQTVTACPAGTIRPPIQLAQESRNVTASAAPNPTVKTPIYMALAQGRFRYVFHKVSACETGGV